MEPVENIIRAIEEAFGGVCRGAVTLHEAEVIDDYGTESERQRARKLDREDDWREVPDVSIAACPNALSFLDPVSWRFYLPAYMRFALRHLEDSRSGAIDHAIYSLDKGEVRDIADWKLERFGTLDAAQARAVQRFLAFAAENDDFCDGHAAKTALDAYWAHAAASTR
ncbi:MAG TPA: DUF6714 family protein [Polyangia bacterium]|nr:DUF6714 family protein [Polyangia bacterium]